jgi:hypothetical protein
MSTSKKKAKQQARTGEDMEERRQILLDTCLSHLDDQWRRHGEDFDVDEEDILLGRIAAVMASDEGLARRNHTGISVTELRVAMGRARSKRDERRDKALITLMEMLPRNLRGMQAGTTDSFVSLPVLISLFRGSSDNGVDVDEGIIADWEIKDAWTEFYKLNGAEILRLTREARTRREEEQARQEQTTVLEGVADFMGDVVAGAIDSQVTTEIWSVVNDIIRQRNTGHDPWYWMET